MLQRQPTGMPFLIFPLPPSHPASPQVLLCLILSCSYPFRRLRFWPPSCSLQLRPHSQPQASPPPQAPRVSSSQAKPSTSHHPPKAVSFLPSRCPGSTTHGTRAPAPVLPGPTSCLHHPPAPAAGSPFLRPLPEFQDGSLPPTGVSPPACAHLPVRSLFIHRGISPTASAGVESQCPVTF